MKILVVGSGGREHALVWKLAQSQHTAKMWCLPGNAGIAQEKLSSNGESVECIQVSSEDLPALLNFAKVQRPDLTVVSSDNPLGMGIVDQFQKEGLSYLGNSIRGPRSLSPLKLFRNNSWSTMGFLQLLQVFFPPFRKPWNLRNLFMADVL